MSNGNLEKFSHEIRKLKNAAANNPSAQWYLKLTPEQRKAAARLTKLMQDYDYHEDDEGIMVRMSPEDRDQAQNLISIINRKPADEIKEGGPLNYKEYGEIVQMIEDDEKDKTEEIKEKLRDIRSLLKENDVSEDLTVKEALKRLDRHYLLD
jgi:DNA-binding MarR family transcriptional regulator